MTRDWIVAHVGAREHYAAARALHARGALRALFTDAWWPHRPFPLARGAESLRALAGRFHAELPRDKVVAYTGWEIARQISRRFLPRDRSTKGQFERYMSHGAAFARKVRHSLARLHPDPAHTVYFGYSNGALETLQWCRKEGIDAIVDQIDPARTEEILVEEEQRKWPGWERMEGSIPASYYDRLRAEWAEAKLVVVNSEWTKAALVEQEVPEERVVVVPLAYEPTRAARPRPPCTRPGIVVLWLGSVILRKGIPYLVQAARILERTPIRFLVAGPIGIADEAVAAAPANMRFIGRVTRDQIDDLYAQADLFVLPTISDGFAITQVEAMANGLPVIATTHCGDVVTPGQDGFLVRAADAPALADAIRALDRDRELLANMSRAALRKAERFSLANYADNLLNVLETGPNCDR